ncbi:hypothetical protein C5C71_01825 [Rathayibacter sp. AY1C1]|uniref:hypothetical protein n=1 Tax=Rathayibacter sp. AY1C1 TaxID=2080534 RepID=UPI000CE857DC|nr:hypothetical protein [Rathayibacter sp. AY1C1]PPH13312.1 hypothetical protein C5C71_01825 [Rathayibacter sp. AY1C1]
MGVVTVPQANPNDELTDTLINQGPNAIAAAVNGNLDDANISALSGSKISAGTLTAAAADTNSNPETRQSETVGNIVASGLIWSPTSGLNGTMTSGVAYVAGKRLPVPAVASYGFTASRDTYVYVDSTGNVQYNPQALGTARPATPANNVLVSKVTTSAGAVTAVSDQRNTTLTDAWRSWTPTWTDLTIGNATVDFRFVVIGKTVHIRGKLIFGTTSSFTPSSGLSFTAPLDYSSTYNVRQQIGNLSIEDAGTASYYGVVRINDTASTSKLQLGVFGAGAAYANFASITSAVPMTWAAGDQLMIAATYEVA